MRFNIKKASVYALVLLLSSMSAAELYTVRRTVNIVSPGRLTAIMNEAGAETKGEIRVEYPGGSMFRDADPSVESYRDVKTVAAGFDLSQPGVYAVYFDSLADTTTAGFNYQIRFMPKRPEVSLDTMYETSKENGISTYHIAGMVKGKTRGLLDLRATPAIFCNTCPGDIDTLPNWTGDKFATAIPWDTVTGRYAYEWNTKAMSPGKYHVFASFEVENPSNDSAIKASYPYVYSIKSGWYDTIRIDNDEFLPHPGNIIAAPINYGVDFSWKKPDSAPSVNGFKIFYGKSSSNLNDSLVAGMVKHAILRGLKNGDTIWYSISSYNDLRNGPGSSPKWVVPGDGQGSQLLNPLRFDTPAQAEYAIAIGKEIEIPFKVLPASVSFASTNSPYDAAKITVRIKPENAPWPDKDTSLGMTAAIHKSRLFLPTDTGVQTLTLLSRAQDVYYTNDTTDEVCTSCADSSSLMMPKLSPGNYHVKITCENLGNPSGTGMADEIIFTVSAHFPGPEFGKIFPAEVLEGQEIVFSAWGSDLRKFVQNGDNQYLVITGPGQNFSIPFDSVTKYSETGFTAPISGIPAGTYSAYISSSNGNSDTLVNIIRVMSPSTCPGFVSMRPAWGDTGAVVSFTLSDNAGTDDPAGWNVSLNGLSCPVEWVIDNFVEARVPYGASTGGFLIQRTNPSGPPCSLTTSEFLVGAGPMASIAPSSGLYPNSIAVSVNHSGDTAFIQIGDHMPVQYTSPVTLTPDSPSVVQAWSKDILGRISPVAKAEYKIVPVPVTIAAPNGGVFSSAVSCTLTCSEPSADIHFSLNGSNITSSSPLYTAPFIIDCPSTLKFRAFYNGVAEDVKNVDFTIENPSVFSYTLAYPEASEVYTNKSPYLVQGTLTSGVSNFILINNNAVPVTGGSFQATVALKQGENSITVSSLEGRGLQAYTAILDTKRPIVYASGGRIMGTATAPFFDTLSSSEPANIYYKFTGDPSYSLYENPVYIDGATTMSFYAVDLAQNVSDTITESYDILEGLVIEASPGPGTYPEPQHVALSVPTRGRTHANIYYTIDGTTPDTGSSIYTDTLIVSHDMTIKAIGADAFDTSAIFEFAYGIGVSLDLDTLSVGSGEITAYEWQRDTMSLTGIGEAVGSNSDNCMFAYQKLGGDFDVSFKVLEPDDISPWKEAGIMARSGTGAGSSMVWFSFRHNDGTNLMARAESDSLAVETAIPDIFYGHSAKLRMVKIGAILTALFSSDGVNWTSVGSAEIGQDSVLIGPAFTAENSARMRVTGFKGFNGGALPDGSPVISITSPVSGMYFQSYYVHFEGGISRQTVSGDSVIVYLNGVTYGKLPLFSSQFQKNIDFSHTENFFKVLVEDPLTGQKGLTWFTCDSTAPQVSFSAPPGLYEKSLDLTICLNEPGNIYYSGTNQPYIPLTSPVALTLKPDTVEEYHKYYPTSYTITAVGYDYAGNPSNQISGTFQIAPEFKMFVSPNPGVFYDSAEVSLTCNNIGAYDAQIYFKTGKEAWWSIYGAPVKLRYSDRLEAYASYKTKSGETETFSGLYQIVKAGTLSVLSVGTAESTSGEWTGSRQYRLNSVTAPISGDGFHFGAAVIAAESSFVFVAKPMSVAGGKQGLAVFKSTYSSTIGCLVSVLNDTTIKIVKREAPGGLLDTQILHVGADNWLKSARQKDTVYFYSSKNSRDWNLITAVNMPGIVYSGLSVVSEDTAVTAQADFDSVGMDIDNPHPVLSITQPADTLWTNIDSVQVRGVLSNANIFYVLANGGYVSVGNDNTFSKYVRLNYSGNNQIFIEQPDLALTARANVVYDNSSPAVIVNPSADKGPFSSPLNVHAYCNESAVLYISVNGEEYREVAQGDTILTLSGNAQVQYYAIDRATNQSAAQSQSYTIISPPVSSANYASGTYAQPLNITLAPNRSSAVVHYSLNGAEPGLESPVFTESIYINKYTTLKFFAVDAWGRENVNTKVYDITGEVSFDTTRLTNTTLSSYYWENGRLKIRASGYSSGHPEKEGISFTQFLPGDFRVIFRMDSLPEASFHAGISVRSTIQGLSDSTRKLGALLIDSAGRIGWYKRPYDNGLTTIQPVTANGAAGIWMQIVRSNDTVWASYSLNGDVWTPVPGHLDIAAYSVNVGPVIIPHSPALEEEFVFSHFYGFAGGSAVPDDYSMLAVYENNDHIVTANESYALKGRIFDPGMRPLTNSISPIYVTVNEGELETIDPSGEAPFYNWVHNVQLNEGENRILLSHISLNTRNAYSLTITKDTSTPAISLLPLYHHGVDSIPVEMQCSENAWIYWQIGSKPVDSAYGTMASRTLYVGESGIFQAWAIDNMGRHSETVEHYYDVHENLNSYADPVSRVFSTPVQVSLKSNSPDAVIYYTTDGSLPTDSSAKFMEGYLEFSDYTTLKFFAVDPWSVETSIHTETYIPDWTPYSANLNVGYNEDSNMIEMAINSSIFIKSVEFSISDFTGVLKNWTIDDIYPGEKILELTQNESPELIGAKGDSISVSVRITNCFGQVILKTGTIYRTFSRIHFVSIGSAYDYSSGTIHIAKGSDHATGINTSWLSANRGQGDSIIINNHGFTIKSVLSDTALLLTQSSNETYEGSNYAIKRKFAEFAPWANQNRNLVSTYESEVAVLYNDNVPLVGSSIGDWNNWWTTDASHTLTVTAIGNNRTYGTAGRGATLDCRGYGISTYSHYMTIDGIEIKNINSEYGLFIAGDHSTVKNCVVHDGSGKGISLQYDNTCDSVYNNIVYNLGMTGIYAGPGSMFIANNTVFNCGKGIEAYGNGSSILNNIAAANISGDYVWTGTHTFTDNISGDNSVPANNNKLNVSLSRIAFVNTTPGQYDLHINETSAARDSGSAIIQTDIDGNTRTSPYDIGADEAGGYIPPAPPAHSVPVRYVSIGTKADYSAGSVQVAAGSRIVTGTGTAWLDSSRGQGDSVIINSIGYTIDSATSNTRLVLTQAASASFTGSYSIKRKFRTFAAWEAQDRDLIMADECEVAVMYNDTASYKTALVDGWKTSVAHRIIITAAPGNRHNGVAGTGVVLDADSHVWTIYASNVSFADLEVRNLGSPYGMYIGGRENVVRSCLFHGGTGHGLHVYYAGSSDSVYNNIIYGFDSAGIDIATTEWNFVANNTVNGCHEGIRCSHGNSSYNHMYAVNNISVGNNADYSEVPGSVGFNANDSNNIAGDNSLVTVGAGPHCLNNITLAQIKFVDASAAARDLHIRINSAARNVGADLGACFTRDIDNIVRTTGLWDIGADENTTVDVIAPVITVSGVSENGMYNNARTITITVTDDQDPEPVYTATLNGQAIQTGHLASDEGFNTLIVFATDWANNKSADTVHFTLDFTPPVVSVSPLGGYHSAAFFNSDSSITLSASDNLSEEPYIHYTLNGAIPDNNSTLYSGPLTHIAAGTLLKAIAYDYAGNASAVVSAEYLGCINAAFVSGTIWVDSVCGNDNTCNECNDSLHPFKTIDTAFSRISRTASLTSDLTVKIGRGTYTIESNSGINLADVRTSSNARLTIRPQDFAKKATDMPVLKRAATGTGSNTYIFRTSSFTTVQGLKFAMTGNGGIHSNMCIESYRPATSSNHIEGMIIERNVFDNSGITAGTSIHEIRIYSTGEGSSKDVYIRNNIFYKGKNPITIRENGCCNSGQRDSAYFIVNNTAYDCDGKFLNIMNDGGTGVMAHLVAANNVISSGNDTLFYGTSPYAAGPYAVYNTIYESSPATCAFQGKNGTFFVQGMCDSSATAFLSTGISDSNFLRPSQNDLAVDWANATYALSTDIWGNSRNQGNGPDAGAVESPYTAPVLTLASHTVDQATDAFLEHGGETHAAIFRFRLTPSLGTAVVTRMAFRLWNVLNISQDIINGMELIADADNDGVVDSNETAIGGAGTATINGSTGRIAFSTSFNVSSPANYILRADFLSLGQNDSLRIGLYTDSISIASLKTGSVASAAHREIYTVPQTRYVSVGDKADYSTGSLQLVAGSRTVTGAGTAWAAGNRDRGDSIIVNGTGYTIDSVRNDTALALFTNARVSCSGASYVIKRKYATLQTWALQGRNLIAANQNEAAVLYKDSVEFTVTSQSHIDGNWQTDSTHRIIMTSNARNRHQGRAGTGAAINCMASVWNLYKGNTIIENLEIRNSGGYGMYLAGNCNVVRNCFFRNSAGTGLHVYYDAARDSVYNNIFFDIDSIGIEVSSYGSNFLANNTVYGCGKGIFLNSGNTVTNNACVVNNICWGNGVDYRKVTGAAGFNANDTNNISGDNSILTIGNAQKNTGNVSSAQMGFLYTAAGSEDLHIRRSSIARNTGANLSSFFTGDIDGNTRAGAWDVGADENVWADTLAPSIAISGVLNGYYYNTSKQVSVAVSDETDTNPFLVIQVDGDTVESGHQVSAEGMHAVNVEAWDHAGNTSYDSMGFTIDLTSPTTWATPAGGDYSEEYFNSDSSVTLTASDTLSDILHIYYTTNGTTPSDASSVYDDYYPISPITDGMAIKYFAQDNAGNNSSVATDIYNLEQTQTGPAPHYVSIGTAGNYTTGSVHLTAGSKTVTGTGTAWKTANRGKGDSLYTVAAGGYVIDTVLTETSLRLTRTADSGYSGSDYSIMRKFSTIQSWISTGRNLVSLDQREVALMYKDGSEYARYDIGGSGWVTDSLHTIMLAAAPGNRHTGIQGTGVVINCNGSVWNIYKDWVTLDGLEGRNSGGTYGLYVSGRGDVVRSCIFRDGSGYGIHLYYNGSSDSVYNNIVYGFASAGINISTNQWNFVANNTVYGCNKGIQCSHGNYVYNSMYVVNNIAWGNGVDYEEVSGSVGFNSNDSNNIGKDSSLVTVGPGPHCQYNVTASQISFVDTAAATRDLHIQGGSVAKDAGARLNNRFTIDIDGEIRGIPSDSLWDIGADEKR